MGNYIELVFNVVVLFQFVFFSTVWVCVCEALYHLDRQLVLLRGKRL